MTESLNQQGQPISAERREALAKMGKYAAYTTPVVMTLLTADKAMAQSVSTKPGKKPKKPKKPK